LRFAFSVPDISTLLQQRASLLKKAYSPFGSLNTESRAKVKSGKVKLPDESELPTDEIQDYVVAISDKLGIDEVWAAVLLRSFLWNHGLPESVAQNGAGISQDLVNDLLASFIPFYTSERLSLIRTLVPLFRANDHESDPLQALSIEVLGTLFPTVEDKEAWVRGILATLKARRMHSPPKELMSTNPRKAAESAFQALNEQLVLLELLFFSIWSFVTPSFELITDIWKEAMEAELGSSSAQSSRDLLRGAKENEVLQDLRTFWILVCIETLSLERLAAPVQEIPMLLQTPGSVSTLETLLSAEMKKHPGDPFYVPLQLALSLYSTLEVDEDPEADSHVKRVAIPRGTFQLLTHLIYNTTVFNLHLAWSRNSALSDPGSVAARSIIKGKHRVVINYRPAKLTMCTVELLMATLDRVALERLQPDQEDGPEELRQFWEALFGFGAFLTCILTFGFC
jgi:nuclear pore complex protein Nup188